MKETLHKFGIFIFFIYIISVYILSYLTEYYMISHVIFGGFFGVTFFYVALRGSIIISKGLYYHFIFLFMMILSYYWIMIDVTSYQRMTSVILLLMLAVLIINIINEEKYFDLGIKLLFYAGIIMCLYSLMFYGYENTMAALFNSDDIRLGGEINEANNYGLICAFTSCIGLYYAYHEKKGIFYFITAIPLVFILASGSRMALIMILTAIIVLVVTKKGKNIFSTIAIWIVSVIVLVTVINYVSGLNMFLFRRFEQFINLFKPSDYMTMADNSSITRFNMIKDGIKWFLQKPILGYGTDQYGILYMQNYGRIRYSHSNVIEVLVNHGIIGFAIYYGLYAYILINLLRAVKRKIKHSVLMLALFGAMIIANIFFVMLYLKPTYIILGLMLAYISIHKHKLEKIPLEEEECDNE